MRQLPKACSKYGADMGRSNCIPTTPCEMVIQQLQWVDGDYDQGGAYWGGPANKGTEYIWWAYDETGEYEVFVRASDRAMAERGVRELAPLAIIVEDDELTIEEMLEAYITCALWSTNDNADDSGGVPLDANYSNEDLTPECRAAMREDVAKFLSENRADIGDKYSQAGHDYWLTRNGHGCGFWDRPELWGKEASRRLTEACEHQEVYLYVGDDKKIHCD